MLQKNNDVLKKSLIISFIIIIPIVFFMGFTGLVAISADPKVVPDLGFFSLLLREQTEFLSIISCNTWISFNNFNS
jgi:hypothetical protein